MLQDRKQKEYHTMMFNEDLTIEQRDFIDMLDDNLNNVLCEELEEEFHRDNINSVERIN